MGGVSHANQSEGTFRKIPEGAEAAVGHFKSASHHHVRPLGDGKTLFPYLMWASVEYSPEHEKANF